MKHLPGKYRTAKPDKILLGEIVSCIISNRSKVSDADEKTIVYLIDKYGTFFLDLELLIEEISKYLDFFGKHFITREELDKPEYSFAQTLKKTS